MILFFANYWQNKRFILALIGQQKIFFHLSKKKKSVKPLEEGVDFYIENGFYVFTAHYLKQRGYCCQNACRHCPYGFKKP